MTYHFNTGRMDDAKRLVLTFHYSRRMPSNIQFIGTLHESGGLFGEHGEAVAACIFTIPPTRWAEPVFELARLVRDEAHKPPLTGLISKTCKAFAKEGADLLVSFADWTQAHHGGIYQAASWNFSGQRERRMDGVMWNGAFVPGRAANSRWGTQSPDKLKSIVAGTIEPHYDEGKFCYWRALSRAWEAKAKRLGLEKLPYPKPSAALVDAPVVVAYP